MPYQHIEEIRSRRGEKIAPLLTLEQALGLILGALPAYLLTLHAPLLLRGVAVLAAATLGVLLTLDVGGMAGYERLLWRARGALRQRLAPGPIRPSDLAGAAPTVPHDRPLPRGGPIRRWEPPSARPARPVVRPRGAPPVEPDHADLPAQ